MRRTLIVHVGGPRTGSTSIQNMLHRLSPALERAGVHVPVAGRLYGRHHNLGLFPGHWNYLPALGGWADVLCEVKRSDAPRCVISSEALLAGPNVAMNDAGQIVVQAVGRVAALARASGRDVRVIAYVRPQYQLLESKYCQLAKVGRVSWPFEKYLADAPNNPFLNYEAVFRPWGETFGERLAVYPLEAVRMPGGLLAHFLSLLGADGLAAEASALPSINQRFGAKHVEVLRLTRLALDDRALDPKAIRERLKPVGVGVPVFLEGDARFAGLSPAQVGLVMEHFAASNARFARAYGVDAGGVLFREPAADSAGRPNVVKWADFGAAERRRVREFVRETAGVELPPGAAERRIRPRLPWRVRLLLEATRFIRTPSGLPGFLRWLRWDLKWRLRRPPADAGSPEGTNARQRYRRGG